jgi:hypothetical protein
VVHHMMVVVMMMVVMVPHMVVMVVMPRVMMMVAMVVVMHGFRSSRLASWRSFGSGRLGHRRREGERRRKEHTSNQLLHHNENPFGGRTPQEGASRPDASYHELSINPI